MCFYVCLIDDNYYYYIFMLIIIICQTCVGNVRKHMTPWQMGRCVTLIWVLRNIVATSLRYSCEFQPIYRLYSYGYRSGIAMISQNIVDGYWVDREPGVSTHSPLSILPNPLRGILPIKLSTSSYWRSKWRGMKRQQPLPTHISAKLLYLNIADLSLCVVGLTYINKRSSAQDG